MTTIRKFMSRFTMLITGLALSACATNQQPLGPKHGQAVRTALNSQIVDPTPARGAPVLHPQKAQAAVERYVNDEVKKHEEAQEIQLVTGN